MHIEFDVVEITFLIGAWFAFKWVYRVVVLVLLGKLIGNVVKRGKESVESIKGQFKEFSSVENDASQDK